MKKHVSQRWIATAAITIALLTLYGSVYRDLHASSFATIDAVDPSQYDHDRLRKGFSTIQRCMINGLRKSPEYVGVKLPDIINDCSRSAFPQGFDLLLFHVEKLFLPIKIKSAEVPPPTQSLSQKLKIKLFEKFKYPNQNSGIAPCISVTLGIGGEVAMEKQLLKYYPGCKLYGADPTPAVSEGFKKLGTYFPYAIDAANSTNKTVWANINPKNPNAYQTITLNTKKLSDLLTDDVAEPLIHFLSVDVEGTEYQLLSYFALRNAKIEPAHKLKRETAHIASKTAENNATESQNTSTGNKTAAEPDYIPLICQMYVELHLPFPKYFVTQNEVKLSLIEFVDKSGFVPIASVPWDGVKAHASFLAVNAVDDACLERTIFRNSKFLDKYSLIQAPKYTLV